MAIEKVKEYFRGFGMEERIMEFSQSSATVELAAKAAGCEPERIAKTLSFLVDGRTVLVVMAGDARVDNKKFKDYFHTKAKMLSPDEVETRTGHAVGGVCPFGIPADVQVFLDISLKRFKTVFPACGSASSAIELTPGELEKYAGSREWIDVCRGWQPEKPFVPEKPSESETPSVPEMPSVPEAPSVPEPSKKYLSRMPGGFFIYEADGDEKITYVNENVLKLFRCRDMEAFQALTGGSFRGMVHPGDLERVESEIMAQIASDTYDYVEYRICCQDGTVLWVEDYGRLVEEENGKYYFYVFLVDATEKIRLRKLVNRRDHLQRVLTTLANDVDFDIHCKDCTIDVYGCFEQRFGRPPRKKDFIPFMCENCEKKGEVKLFVHSYPMEEQSFDKEEQDVVMVDGEGNNLWTRCQIAHFKGKDGGFDRKIGRMLDTHEQTMREIYYRQGAEKDCLTGIYNRRSGERLIKRRLKSMEQTTSCMMIMLDVDGFKMLNDTYGHPFGDNILLQVACALQSTFRKNDICARIGGDEFMVFLEDVRDKGVCLKRLQQLVTYTLQDESVEQYNVTLSAGVSYQTGSKLSYEEMYRRADEALYEAKRAGKRSFRVYSENDA